MQSCRRQAPAQIGPKTQVSEAFPMSLKIVSSIGAPVSIGQKLASSDSFKSLFREGMGLVEAAASYLDSTGREESRRLPRIEALAYASESMRLTTRLMQLASWLLLQRAIGAGEMNPDEVRKERHRISLSDIGRGNPLPGAEQLPAALNDIVERSLSLHQRILKFDAMLKMQAKADTPSAPSPVSSQIDRIAAVFSAPRG